MKTKSKKSKPKVEKTTKRSRTKKEMKNEKTTPTPVKSAKKGVPTPEVAQLSGSSAIYTTKTEHNGLPAGTQFKERTDQRWQAYDAEGKQLDVIMNRVDMEGNPNVFQQIK